LKKKVIFEDLSQIKGDQFLNLNYSSLQGMRILVTGCQGMLGGAIAVTFSELLRQNLIECELYLASRVWQNSSQFGYEKSVKFLSNDKAREGSIEFDLIIHCASPSNITRIKSLEELRDVNTGYLKDCISTTTKKIIYISSGEVYGGSSTQVDLIPPMLNPEIRRHWYPISKLETELFLKKYKSLSVDIVRLFHTFGPGLSHDDGRSFADIIYSAANHSEIVLKSNGRQIRSFLYISDAVLAILICMTEVSTYRVLNVGSSNEISIIDFARLVSEITGSKISYSHENFDHSLFDKIVPDISETTKIGWTPHVELSEAVTATLAWIKS